MENIKKKYDKIIKIKNILFFCFNLVYILAYTIFIATSIMKDNQQKQWISIVLAVFIVAYLVLFIVIVALGKNTSQVSYGVKTYKSSLKIVKKLFKLINLMLALSMVINTVGTERNFFNITLSVVSVLFVILQIALEIYKIIKRRKKYKFKQLNSQVNQKYIDDLKQILGFDEEEDEKYINNLDKNNLDEKNIQAENSTSTEDESEAREVVADSDIKEIEISTKDKVVFELKTKEKTNFKDKLSNVKESVDKTKKKIQAVQDKVKQTGEKIKTAKKNAQDVADKTKKVIDRTKEYREEKKQIKNKASQTKSKKSQTKE